MKHSVKQKHTLTHLHTNHANTLTRNKLHFAYVKTMGKKLHTMYAEGYPFSILPM